MSWEQECNLARFQRSLTDCNSALLPVKYLFMSGAGKRVSGRKIQWKAMEQWDVLRCTAVCEGKEGCCVPVGSVGPERWPTDTSSSQNSILHMFSSLTHSPHTVHDLTPTAAPLERYTSAALCYKTRSHPCMLVHAVHTWTDFILLYWIFITQFRVNLKITCLCWRVHFTCVSKLTLDKGSILWPKM